MKKQVSVESIIKLLDQLTGSIHLIDSEKGGVGKSTFARLFIEFLQIVLKLAREQMEIIDADKDQPLIGRTYAPEYYPTEDEKKGNVAQVSNLNDLVKEIHASLFF